MSTRLIAGTPAPDFHAKTLQGEDCSLARFAGKPLWLAFFRFATCPLCNLRVHQLATEWPRFEGRIQMLAIFQSPPERFENYISKQNPPFPVVSDPELELFRLFQVETSVLKSFSTKVFSGLNEARKLGMPLFDGPKDGGSFRVPADFLIDRKGTLAVCRYGEHIADNIPTEKVRTFLSGQG